MVTAGVSVFVLCLTFITVSQTGPALEACQILEVSPTAADGKLIRVGCGEKTVSIDLLEGGSYSTLKVIGEQGRNLLTVDYFKNSREMFLVIEGEQFDAKDEKSKAKEGEKFKELLDDPDFEFFPEAVRLIHDQLQLKGWESPAVMFLYRMGIAAENYHTKINKKGDTVLKKRLFGWGKEQIAVDPNTYKYHGSNPTKKCTYNGWSDPSMDNLISNECRGVCGQVCTSCWEWVCNDCCLHNGCYRHDLFCDIGGYMGPDCLSCRGVLWDMQTEMPYDC
ncbi:uncharacterized protein LOC134824617 isoform X1 [Bolinopsis microptera]|uniref:uncharacterized protein LOC134824617 isoform X1 n=1 Tax=Bolinopsis microptera TaxID=2820187 RepID=UPI00307A64F4